MNEPNTLDTETKLAALIMDTNTENTLRMHTKQVHHALSLSFWRVLVLEVIERPAAYAGSGVQRRKTNGREGRAFFGIRCDVFHAGAETSAAGN